MEAQVFSWFVILVPRGSEDCKDLFDNWEVNFQNTNSATELVLLNFFVQFHQRSKIESPLKSLFKMTVLFICVSIHSKIHFISKQEIFPLTGHNIEFPMKYQENVHSSFRIFSLITRIPGHYILLPLQYIGFEPLLGTSFLCTSTYRVEFT